MQSSVRRAGHTRRESNPITRRKRVYHRGRQSKAVILGVFWMLKHPLQIKCKKIAENLISNYTITNITFRDDHIFFIGLV